MKKKLKTQGHLKNRAKRAQNKKNSRSISIPLIIFTLLLGGAAYFIWKNLPNELNAVPKNYVQKVNQSKVDKTQQSDLSPKSKKLFSQKIDIKSAVSEIDKLVGNKLSSMALKRNAEIDDLTFVRRVYLDIAGRIPSIKERKDFQSDTSENKRSELIDTLLASESYFSHNFNYWADILRVINNMPKHKHGGNYIAYIKDSIRSNKPYDQFVYEMIAAEGHAYKDGNGATGYYLRDEGMPLDNISNTMKIFLGTDITCAQCHDHPYEDWTQVDFYKLAAFTSGTEVNTPRQMYSIPKFKELRDYRIENDHNLKLKAAMVTGMYTFKTGVFKSGSGVIELPHDYKYDDYKAFEKIYAEVPFATSLLDNKYKDKQHLLGPKDDLERRKDFAKWLSSSDNPMFTKTIVNRLWLRIMGAPLIASATDLKQNEMGINPGLSQKLIDLMKEVDFDLREFSRVLYRTRTYQSALTMKVLAGDETYAFQGPVFRRLSAEQLWDSLSSLILENPDIYLNQKTVHTENQIYKILKEKSYEELIEYFNKIAKSGEKLYDKVASDEAILHGKNKEQKGHTHLVRLRASENPSPVRPDHFLRQFGASARTQVEGALTEPTIPQALNLLNSQKVEEQIIKPMKDYLTQDIQSCRTPEEAMKVIFLAILCREASKEEIDKLRPYFSEMSRKPIDDLMWVLLNSNEFKFYN
ncbi:DUF1549 domain-containing protein [Lentisphaera profundi]|uniref:DUF1549 domain-containing protein n=1 Tax=Lentisphaera profundi TaxID=1658616 RepID=A0ABY7VXJ1_9BACT|nr:DUF1549 domain-containing protein [Lentisphaera profundi]WDE97572.1 DUF1549 domain-containing protein [Lentisphaera profundi]